MNTNEDPGDGGIYGAFVSVQLNDQRVLKESLERRASALITTSGVLVTLLFGLSALTTRREGYRLPTSAHLPLLIALSAFVVAVALAVVVGIPAPYRAPKPNELEIIRLEKWRDREWVARRRVAGTEIVQLESYRRANGRKALLLLGAGIAQLVALAALAITVGIILLQG